MVANVDLADLVRDCESILSRLPVIALPLVLPSVCSWSTWTFTMRRVRICPGLLRLLA